MSSQVAMCRAMSEWDALNTFLEGLRPGAMLGGEQCDPQRLSKAIAIAGKLIELADVKSSSNVSSRPMPRYSGNSGRDREKVQQGDDRESSSSGQGEPSTVRSQGISSGKNDKRMSREALPYNYHEEDRRKRSSRNCGGTSVKAAKSIKRLGPIEGINAAKQGSRRGKAIDVEAVEPRGKLDAIANVQAIKSGAKLGEATCSKVAESRGKHGATISSQVVSPGSKRDETASVKAVEHKKGPGAIARDKAIKPRVQSEQVRSQRLVLKVPSLTEEDGFFTFMFGLKPWAKRVLERREVKELSKALTTAESIKEFGKSENEEVVVSRVAEKIHSMMNQMRAKIELSREEDEPRIEKALRLGSVQFISGKASEKLLLYNNLVIACLDKGLIRLLLEYLKKMRELRHPVSYLVFNRLIILHSSLGRRKTIPKILSQMKADKVVRHVSTYNILMKIEANEHNIEGLGQGYTAAEAYVEAVEEAMTGITGNRGFQRNEDEWTHKTGGGMLEDSRKGDEFDNMQQSQMFDTMVGDHLFNISMVEIFAENGDVKNAEKLFDPGILLCTIL
ncbi:hypothetical protein F3Y22_tig00110893pilonHSYRG01081 [Hibiscus syriacus]|uniref:Uncharacterized protein n=1 Tax=Hibiscus syriacus TaxID=106335 RepID=A0A6A2ZIU0_HIBSY|nr:hypothetical protein F3Y22_tig00110893pilonHSYRG01081 [Hibiscus syriacus]